MYRSSCAATSVVVSLSRLTSAELELRICALVLIRELRVVNSIQRLQLRTWFQKFFKAACKLSSAESTCISSVASRLLLTVWCSSPPTSARSSSCEKKTHGVAPLGIYAPERSIDGTCPTRYSTLRHASWRKCNPKRNEL